ncbi:MULTISPECIES: M23 family metallopeptidase [Actinomycetes]|uniref:M23 family metallopeptidase n=1 Tax=Actinomycetes TaxID=1760 RepID=UPI0001B55B38|nr:MULTISPECIES: M23 family metallopeptidase [Actinomycetes]EFL09011.1 M24/M37 family peptidase [Streptomyces sp. AA4]
MRRSNRVSAGARGGLGAGLVLAGFAGGAAFAAVARAAPAERERDLTATGHEVLPVSARPPTAELAVLKSAAQVRDDRLRRAEKARQEAGQPRAYAPVTGTITSNYGARWGTTHYGLDVANAIGTPVRTPLAGTVLEAGPASGFGLWVRVRHDDGTVTVYGHVNRYSVSAGQRVAAGQAIAEVGDRGQSTGPHLHFEVWAAGERKTDPLRWLRGLGVRIAPGG